MLGSIVLWSVLAWLFWEPWTSIVTETMRSTTVAGWLQQWSAVWVVDYTAVFVVVVSILPAIFVTALVITEIIAMPVIVKFVGERYFPALRREAGGTLTGGLLNTVAGITLFAVLWVVTLPLWLTGVGAVLVPLLNSAWLNQCVFRYDALSEHASADEMREITRASRCDLFLLGILLSLLLYVPLFNLLVPVLSGLAFTHFCLARLQAARGKPS